MNESRIKFFTTKYSELSSARKVFYSLFVASCFGIVGTIAGELKSNLTAGCFAIVFIHLLGKWCDLSQNPKTTEIIEIIGGIIGCIAVFLVLFRIVGLALLKMFM